MPKLQVNISDEAKEIIENLYNKAGKSHYVDLAIKYFANSKTSNMFINKENIEKKEEISEVATKENTKKSNKFKIEKKEW